MSSFTILLYQFKFRTGSPNTFTIDDLPSNGKCGLRKTDIIGTSRESLNESPWYEFDFKIKYIQLIQSMNFFLFFWLDRMALLHFRKRNWKLHNLLFNLLSLQIDFGMLIFAFLFHQLLRYLIERVANGGGGFLCGGTLIHENYVLTGSFLRSLPQFYVKNLFSVNYDGIFLILQPHNASVIRWCNEGATF